MFRKSLRRFFGAVRIEEWIAITNAIIVTAINVFVYQNRFSAGEVVKMMLRYFTLGKIQNHSQVLILALWFVFCGKLYFHTVKIVSERIVKKQRFMIDVLRESRSALVWLIRLSLVLLLVSISYYMLLANLSYEFRYSGRDLLLIVPEQILTGHILALYLPSIFMHPFWQTLFQYAYLLLGIIMGALLVILASRKKWEGIFRQNILAFVFSLVISFPIFAYVPCQDPNNYFIRNLRHYKFPPPIERDLANYHPTISTLKIIETIGNSELNVSRDNTVPISCFPSMHTVWALFVVYFLARLWRPTLFFSIPWVLLLMTGGIYFAQHYLIDYIIAFPVAALSLYLASLALKLEKKWRGDEQKTPQGNP